MKKFGLALLAVFLFFIGLFFMICGFEYKFFLVLGVLSIAAGVMAIVMFQKNDKINNSKKNIKKKVVAKHLSGLSIPQGLSCKLLLDNVGLQIAAGNTSYTIPHDKIIDIMAKNEVEVQNQYTSSTGGAIVGLALFGIPGALIGGRSHTKEVRNSHYFLIVSYYAKDGAVKYASFDATARRYWAKQFAKAFDGGQKVSIAL